MGLTEGWFEGDLKTIALQMVGRGAGEDTLECLKRVTVKETTGYF
jgi:hypothetical protein